MRKIQPNLGGIRRKKQNIAYHLSIAFVALLVLLCIGSLAFETIAPKTINASDGIESSYLIRREPIQIETSDCKIADAFNAEVKNWEEKICEWSNTYELDPNLIATVMQVESNGNPNALSYAGAIGLFQVMPYHFDLELGEDPYYPDSNAYRGINYLKHQLNSASGSHAAAFAGYNGGPKAREWYLAQLTREQYISYLVSLGYSYQVSFNKADQVEKYVQLCIALYQRATFD